MIVVLAITDRAVGDSVDVDGVHVCFSSAVTAPPQNLDALRAHDVAVRAVHDAVDACLPVRFGEVHDDKDALVRDVRPRVAALQQALAHVRGREQMILRVGVGDPVVVDDDGAGPGARFLKQKAQEQKVPELDELRRALSDIVVDEKREPAQAPLRASVFHLIGRGQSERYLDVIRVTETRVRLKVTGPFPCWAFT